MKPADTWPKAIARRGWDLNPDILAETGFPGLRNTRLCDLGTRFIEW